MQSNDNIVISSSIENIIISNMEYNESILLLSYMVNMVIDIYNDQDNVKHCMNNETKYKNTNKNTNENTNENKKNVLGYIAKIDIDKDKLINDTITNYKNNA